MKPTLTRVGTTALRELRQAIAKGELRLPLSRHDLGLMGIHEEVAAILGVLGGHASTACLAILDAVIAEREALPPGPELVWSGPEAPKGKARDTAVVLRRLFEGAQQSVILAGYSFDHAEKVLEPLASNMEKRELEVLFFVNIKQAETKVAPQAYLVEQLGGFIEKNWPFGPPLPRLYFDKRALEPGPPYASLHAKCVVVDDARAFISSANFTQRGQERNIEAGVLIHDPRFARHLGAQWRGLIASGVVGEYVP